MKNTMGALAVVLKLRGEDELLGECMKRGMVMKLKKCKKFLIARVSVDGSDGKWHTLTMFNNVIMKIVDGII